MKAIEQTSGAHQHMSEREFVRRVGRYPTQDDLHRVNCPDAGNIGHQQCGWCETCDAPRFQCSHILPMKSSAGVAK